MLLEEVDEISVDDLTSDEPTVGSDQDKTQSDSSEMEKYKKNIDTQTSQQGTDDISADSTVAKYEKAKELVDEMEANVSQELKSRIEELDDMVNRLGGLEDNSLLSVLKQGMATNETLQKIYEREHRQIGKVSAAISALSQNLKSYIP